MKHEMDGMTLDRSTTFDVDFNDRVFMNQVTVDHSQAGNTKYKGFIPGF